MLILAPKHGTTDLWGQRSDFIDSSCQEKKIGYACRLIRPRAVANRENGGLIGIGGFPIERRNIRYTASF
jgi:hypothetical protein